MKDLSQDAELLFDAELEPDRESIERATRDVVGEQRIKVIGRENRVRLYKQEPVQINSYVSPGIREADTDYFSISFRCTLHPHPECRFQYARVAIDMSEHSPGVIVRDLFPREVVAPLAIEKNLKLTAALEYGFLKVAVDRSTKFSQEIYYPKLYSFGRDSQTAYWDFRAIGDDVIRSDGLLFMLLSAPSNSSVHARITVAASVRTGASLIIPLAIRKGQIEETYRLI